MYADRGAVYILNLNGVPKTQIIDDGDPGFAIESGVWGSGVVGTEGDNRNASRFGGSKVASWTFTDLVPGVYRVSATWVGSPARATDAPFSLFDGGDLLTTVDVNQQVSPSGSPDLTNLGVNWQDLGGEVLITSNTMTVELSNDPDGYVMADAIRIERIRLLPPPVQIIDDGDPGFAIESGSWGFGNAGAEGDNRNASTSGGTKVARWTFSDLTPGVYRISATWVGHPVRATDAPYTIFDGFSVVSTVDVNQQMDAIAGLWPVTPVDRLAERRHWKVESVSRHLDLTTQDWSPSGIRLSRQNAIREVLTRSRGSADL